MSDICNKLGQIGVDAINEALNGTPVHIPDCPTSYIETTEPLIPEVSMRESSRFGREIEVEGIDSAEYDFNNLFNINTLLEIKDINPDEYNLDKTLEMKGVSLDVSDSKKELEITGVNFDEFSNLHNILWMAGIPSVVDGAYELIQLEGEVIVDGFVNGFTPSYHIIFKPRPF